MAHDESERWKSVRAAVKGGWGDTFRYILIISIPGTLTIAAIWSMRLVLLG